jgi:hypothetical protein
MKGVSVLSLALLNSLKEMAASNVYDETKSEGISFINKNGDIYLPFDNNLLFSGVSHSTDALKLSSFEYDDADMWRTSQYTFIEDYVSGQVTTIKYDETVYLPSLLEELASAENIYGVIVQKEGYMFNPLHPINAYMIALGFHELPTTGELHVFEWKKSIIKKIKEEESSRSIQKKKKYYKKEYQRLLEVIPDTLIKDMTTHFHQTVDIREKDIDLLVEQPFIERLETGISITKKETGDTNKVKSVLIPTQITIGSMATPYYGLIYLKDATSSNLKGFSFTPMYSGNINQTGEEDASPGQVFRSAETQNVCTGSESAILPKGWFTLSRVNLTSMYYEKIVDMGSVLPFVEASKSVSHELWAAICENDMAALDEGEEVEAEETPVEEMEGA